MDELGSRRRHCSIFAFLEWSESLFSLDRVLLDRKDGYFKPQ